MNKNLIPMMKRFWLSIFLAGSIVIGFAQYSTPELKAKIAKYKQDQRGPYLDIRWFCKDGSIRQPRDPCPNPPGGFQRASYKDEILDIARKNHLFLGQILSTTDHQQFWDDQNLHSRLKQYLLEQYLYTIDEGWILQKAKYYRGAFQVEDEENWGIEFFSWLFEYNAIQESNFFLIREMLKTLPHGGDNNLLFKIRTGSKSLSEQYARFMDLRTKIHSKPEVKDIQQVEQFLLKNENELTQDQRTEFKTLIQDMRKYYSDDGFSFAKNQLKLIRKDLPIYNSLALFLEKFIKITDSQAFIVQGSDLLVKIKQAIFSAEDAKSTLALFDISINLESKILSLTPEWKTSNIGDVIEKSCYLGQISCATGHLFNWEWDQLMGTYTAGLSLQEISLDKLNVVAQALRMNINWGTSLINSLFDPEIQKFAAFEPMANGFLDDKIRSSILLHQGELVALLRGFIAEKAKWKNEFFGSNTATILGLNPGYSKAKLHVIENLDSGFEIDPKGIYVFKKPPADLDPVSGILALSEGNVVSHLQLLARNLGIPNATITEELFLQLKNRQGQEVFFAVSSLGGVVIKEAQFMTNEENELFKVQIRKEDLIRIPEDAIVLEPTILNLREVDASFSGKVCGPKAANLGQLKKMFPQEVVEGLVIPFGVFKNHMDLAIPDLEPMSYWLYLTKTFGEAETQLKAGISQKTVDEFVLKRLDTLRHFIQNMPLLPEFIEKLKSKYKLVLGKEIGNLPVFLRSDTNMEDLKDFTGAGLNLTLFNVLEEAKIYQGIKDVWASPYTERSYKWRQKYLQNPENVYPSILIIPSVFVDYSGVIITKDIIYDQPGRLTVAFSRGAGGAVDGQQAETRLLSHKGYQTLISPARDFTYKSLGQSGGTVTLESSLAAPILTHDNIRNIWEVVAFVERTMPAIGMKPPYDIELGFKNAKLWLFQIRPFVENKKAVSSEYLIQLNPRIPAEITLSMQEPIH